MVIIAGHATSTENTRYAYIIFVGKSEEVRSPERPRDRWEDDIVTCISSARQRLAKHVPEHYAVNKNKCSLLDSGFIYHGTKHVSGTTHT
jgi:hypothetical protein